MATQSEQTVVPTLEEPYQYHCFIAFSYLDEAIALNVERYLTDCGFKVSICHDFALGRRVSDNIHDCVKKSRRAVVLLSKDYISSAWFDMETLLFIHTSQENKCQMMVPVLIGDDIKEKFSGSRLAAYNYLEYKGTDDDLRKIAKAVAAPDIPMRVSLPCGNVSQGFVWSFYYGYLKLILPGMRERSMESEWWDSGVPPTQRKMVHKVFILIPNSGLCPASICDCDENIQLAGKLKPFKKTRAGIIDREYHSTIYKITHPDTKEEYFAPCEFATPVLSLYEMEQDVVSSGLTRDAKEHQIIEFKELLDQVLSHKKMEGNFKIIFYQDLGGGKAEIAATIVAAIKAMLEEEELIGGQTQPLH